MLQSIIDSFNFCSSNQSQVKEEIKIEEAKQYNEKTQSPEINSVLNNLKFSKIDTKIKKQNVTLFPLDNNTNFSFFSKKKTEISEEIGNSFLFSKKSSFSNEEIENNYKLILCDFEGDLLDGKILKISLLFL